MDEGKVAKIQRGKTNKIKTKRVSGGVLMFGVFGLFGLLNSSDGCRSPHRSSYSYAIEKQKLDEMKRKNSILERESYIREVSQMSDEKLLDLLSPKEYEAVDIARGGIGNSVLWKSKPYMRKDVLPSDKYEIVLAEVTKRDLNLNK